MSAQTDIEPVATTFRAIGTDHTILATDPDALEPAVRLAQQHLADLGHRHRHLGRPCGGGARHRAPRGGAAR